MYSLPLLLTRPGWKVLIDKPGAKIIFNDVGAMWPGDPGNLRHPAFPWMGS
jgi:hypothetical protein